MQGCPSRLCQEPRGLQSPMSQGPTHLSFIMPGRVGPAFSCEAFEKYRHFPLQMRRLLVLGLQLYSPQRWDFWRSSFLHAMAQIPPVDKTTSAYSLLGIEVRSIPQNPEVWEQAGHNRPRCYLPDSQSHIVCVCRRTHGGSSLCCDEGQGQAEVFFGRARNPMSLQPG